MSEILQWTAAIVVLAAFALSQRGAWPVTSYGYLGLNLVGGAGLPVRRSGTQPPMGLRSS